MPVPGGAHRGDLQLTTSVLRLIGLSVYGRPWSVLRPEAGREPKSRKTEEPDSLIQSNRELTLCSAWVYLIALLSSSPTERIVSLSNRRCAGTRMVSVTTTSLIGEAVSRSTAGPLSRACVAQT